MVWFKVDDGFPSSRKVLAIPRDRRLAAVGVWLLAGTWCAGQLTDGFIPFSALFAIPGAKKFAKDLVFCGLFEEKPDGFQFHDWQHYQPARTEVIHERERNAARQKAYRDRKRAEWEATKEAARNGVTNDAPTRPDPTRPDRSSYGTTRSASAPRASARTRTPKESTATRRARDAAAAVDTIIAARAEHTNGNPQPKQIGP